MVLVVGDRGAGICPRLGTVGAVLAAGVEQLSKGGLPARSSRPMVVTGDV